MSFEITDESVPGEERHQLRVNGSRMVLLQAKHGYVKFNFQICGPFHLDEAKILVDGMLHLCVIADEIQTRIKR